MEQNDEVEGNESTPLEDLFNEAVLASAARNKKQPRQADPSLRQSLDAAAKKMRELYTLPENWERKRGVALIDDESSVLVGNFSEYHHRSIPNTKKWLREHLPIAIDATERVRGYLGARVEERLGGKISWTENHLVVVDVMLSEFMVECPQVRLSVYTRLGVIVRADLEVETQFASVSGETLLLLPAGTDILDALGTDSRSGVRKAAGL